MSNEKEEKEEKEKQKFYQILDDGLDTIAIAINLHCDDLEKTPHGILDKWLNEISLTRDSIKKLVDASNRLSKIAG